jgi:hypothetical protein
MWVSKSFSGDRLAGYASVPATDANLCRVGAWVFGGLDLGINLPAAWQNATGPGKVWGVGPNQSGQWSPGSWGGHSVPVVAYDAEGLTVVTWGAEQRMTWAALSRYADEAWVCASWDWCVSGTTPAGIDKDAFVSAFGDLGGGPLGPDPTPPGPPPPPSPPPPPPGPVAGEIMIDLTQHRVSLPPGWSAAPVG